MSEERKTMGMEGLPAPAFGASSLRSSTPNAGATAAPKPEVVAKPKRRQFTAKYRLHILEEADRYAGRAEVGQLLRREGLDSSYLANWRKARDEGAFRGLRSKKRGVKPKPSDPLGSKVRELEAKGARLEKDLHKAHIILDV